jgi:hypothetical protein
VKKQVYPWMMQALVDSDPLNRSLYFYPYFELELLLPEVEVYRLQRQQDLLPEDYPMEDFEPFHAP